MWKHKRLFAWIEREIFGRYLTVSLPLWYNTGTAHIGHMNAYRYRGYYYDRETGLYYLNTRYYDPETGRFINRDSVAYADASFLNGLNLYAYCNNNPVMHIDPNGNAWWWIVTAAAALTAVAINHIISVAQCSKADKVVEDTYTTEEAIAAIEEVLGDEHKGKVKIENGVLSIIDSDKVTSRYDRILISKIFQNTVDEKGNKLTNRTTYGLAAEWALHNFASRLGIKKEHSKDVDLDGIFQKNKGSVRLATVLWMVIGGL